MNTRVAGSAAEVRSRAPIDGWYWVRCPDDPRYALWSVAYVADAESVAFWLLPFADVTASDSRLVGFEIIGPIPEPPT